MKLVIFEGRLGWYWRLQSGNNRIVAIGGEPFSSVRSARRSFWNVAYATWTNTKGSIAEVNVPRARTRRRKR